MIAMWLFMMMSYIIFRTRFDWKFTISIAALCILGCIGHGIGACSWWYSPSNNKAVDIACPKQRIPMEINQVIIYGSYTLMFIVIIAASIMMLTDFIAYKPDEA